MGEQKRYIAVSEKETIENGQRSSEKNRGWQVDQLILGAASPPNDLPF